MSRRTQRIESLIRRTVGELLLSKMSDPRLDKAMTTVTRVEVPEDLLTATVYFSVIGTEAHQRRTLHALTHAAGHIQELMMREIRLRNTPLLEFRIDKQFKKTLQTLQLIQQAMEEIHQKEQARAAEGASAPPADGDQE